MKTLNQYLKARERGLSPGDANWPKQAKTRVPMHDRTKAKISATKAIQALERIMDESDSDSAVVAAAGKLLDKVIPTMSSIDSTLIDKTEKMSEEALVSQLRTLIENNPELVSKVLGDNARGKGIKAA